VAVSGYSRVLCQLLVLDGRFENGTGLQLPNARALYFLPRSLARWREIPSRLVERPPSSGKLLSDTNMFAVAVEHDGASLERVPDRRDSTGSVRGKRPRQRSSSIWPI
jgi:hypothetical protein